MKPEKHRWLCIFTAQHTDYYVYRSTKTEIKNWLEGREGKAEVYKLKYEKVTVQR